MSVRGLRWLLIGVVLALPVSARAAIQIFLASLDAAQEIQAVPVVSPAVGSAILAFDDVTNTFDLTLAGLGLTTPIVAAHFHRAPAGVSGPVVKDLGVPGSFAESGGYAFHAVYLNAAAGGLLLSDLLSGNSYLNVHTERYRSGEIRGQLGQLVPIPEPATWVLLAGGFVLVAASALRRREANWGVRI
jgi:hypothetical protein